MSNRWLKDRLISSGLYRPARYVHDRLICPARGREMGAMRRAFARFVRAGDLCFDIGANIGQKSQAMSQLGARVVSVEPQPRCMQELRARCRRYPGFVPVEKAVGQAPGRETIYIAPADVFSSMHRDWSRPSGAGPDAVRGLEVEVTTLDRLIEAHGVPDFCKIDVEGYEWEVLGGLTRPLKVLSFEFHNRDHPEFLPAAYRCLEHLAGLGAIRVNVSLSEDMALLLDEFLPYPEFLPYFQDLCRRPGTVYGDLYVRFVPDAARPS